MRGFRPNRLTAEVAQGRIILLVLGFLFLFLMGHVPVPAKVPTTQPHKNECGGASWYGPGFNGKKAASGERFDQNAMTAAHKTLPFGTIVKVVDQRTGKSVQVRINDRGPYIDGRIIDLSHEAARRLGMLQAGTAKVCLVIQH